MCVGGMCVCWCLLLVGNRGEWGRMRGEREREGSAWLCLCLCLCSPSLPTHTHTRCMHPHPHPHTSTHFPLLPSLSLSLGWPCLLPPSPSLPPSPLSSPLPQHTQAHAWPWLHAASPSTPHSPPRKKRRKRGENTQHNQAAMQHKHITHHCMR